VGGERRALVAGNWKMHGDRATAVDLAAAVRDATASVEAEVVVCPPAVHLDAVCRTLAGSHLAVGAQDVSPHAPGPWTGQVAASMLLDIGCRWVIVGHSERRADCAETDDLIGRKASAALAAGLCVIACVGETLAQREAGFAAEVVAAQMLPLLGPCATHPGRFVVAYEPVWAIGTGRSASAEEAQEVHARIRRQVAASWPEAAPALRILYGGSVNPAVAAGLFAMPDIDGALVGGASLKAADFALVCGAAHVP
jgi:triosephosphate isomerase